LIGSRLSQHVAYRLYDHDQYFYSAFGTSTVLHTRHRFEYHGDIALPVAGTFSYGIDYDRENATVSTTRHFRNNYGYYAQQQLSVARRLNITAGVRLEDNTTFHRATTPRLAVSYRLRDVPSGSSVPFIGGTRLRFAAGAGIKEPSFIENFSQSSFFLGNPDLAAERSRSWEVGVEQSIWGDRLNADLGWFDNRFRNLIELVSKPIGTSQYFNIGRELARGVEFRVHGRVRKLSIQTNYTYLDGHIQESTQTSFPFRPGDPLLRRPRHSSDVSLTWTERRWNAFWSTRYVGRRADSDFFTFSQPLLSNDAYWSSNAAVSVGFGAHISAFLRLENIFNSS
jgi:vitamin B12 transporter